MASTKSRRGVLLDGPAPPLVRVAPQSRANSWEDVADLAATLGIPLDEWQEQVLEAAMGERADGRWASKFIGLSAPRQNGKSQLIVARALAGVLLFGEKTIIISAHETDTAREVWRRLIDVIEDNPTLEARVTGRMNAVNRESLTFGEGLGKQIIKVKARSATGSRGFSADCLLLDEAQILGKQAWGSIVPTMSARPNPQLWLFGTPPTTSDDPFAFARVREQSKLKKARHCWLEWAAAPGSDFNDLETWAKANPSFGVRISAEACADDRAAMDDEQFGMERLGIWGEVTTSGTALNYPAWLTLADPSAPRGSSVVFGADVAEDRSAWLAVAWNRPDGGVQVMLANDGNAMPPGRLADECARVTSEWGGVVVPPKAFEDDIDTAGAAVHKLPAGGFTAGCGLVADHVTAGTIHHGNQPALNTAVKAARWRSAGATGERAFQLKDFPEVGPLAAVVRAVAGLAAAADYDPLASVL